MIPDDIKQSLDVLGLYKGISSHPLMTWSHLYPCMDSSNLAKAQVGKAQARYTTFCQKVADAVRTSLGMHFKFYVDVMCDVR